MHAQYSSVTVFLLVGTIAAATHIAIHHHFVYSGYGVLRFTVAFTIMSVSAISSYKNLISVNITKCMHINI